MFEKEIRDTVMIAVSMILLSILFGFIVYALNIRDDFAQARNNEIVTKDIINVVHKYGYLEGANLSAEDVIGLIRDNYDTDITVRVNNVVYTRSQYLMNKEYVSLDKLKTIYPTYDNNGKKIKYKSFLAYSTTHIMDMGCPKPASNRIKDNVITGILVCKQ